MKKKLDHQRKTLPCIVNQLLFFPELCTGLEIEDGRVVVEVMDWNQFSAQKIVGVYKNDGGVWSEFQDAKSIEKGLLSTILAEGPVQQVSLNRLSVLRHQETHRVIITKKVTVCVKLP